MVSTRSRRHAPPSVMLVIGAAPPPSTKSTDKAKRSKLVIKVDPPEEEETKGESGEAVEQQQETKDDQPLTRRTKRKRHVIEDSDGSDSDSDEEEAEWEAGELLDIGSDSENEDEDDSDLESEVDSQDEEIELGSESELELGEDEKEALEQMLMEALGGGGGFRLKGGGGGGQNDTYWQDQIGDSKIPEPWRSDLLKRAKDIDDEDPYHRDRKAELLLRRVMQIPFGVYTPRPVAESPDQKRALLQEASKALDRTVYGMKTAKNEVLNILAQMLAERDGSVSSTAEVTELSQLTALNEVKSGEPVDSTPQPKEAAPMPRIFCLVSPAGGGKTALATQGLKAVLNRPAITFSMAGMTDAGQLLGCSFYYEGSHPGGLYDALVTAKCMDPILVFDEVDKVSETASGRALVNTLIHLTDPLTNSTIKDAYLAPISLDLSACPMVFLCNDPDNIPGVLRDRMHFIHVDTPSQKDRVHIVQHYLWAQVLNGLKLQVALKSVQLSKEAIETLVERAANDSSNDRNSTGLRGVKHMLTTVALTLNRQNMLDGTELPQSISSERARDIVDQAGHGHRGSSGKLSVSAMNMYL